MSVTTRTVNLERFKNSVGLMVTFSAKWGNVRKGTMDKVKLAEGADKQEEQKAKQRIALKKQLIVSPEYDAIKRFQGEIRSWIYSKTVPSFFKEGFQLCGLGAVSDIESRLKRARVELQKLVDAFADAYPARVEEARAVLEPVGQFSARDYPPQEFIRNAFDISWNWIAFTVPEGLPAELRQAEEEKLQRQFQDAGEEIITALRVAFGELIAHATERLTVGPDGKQKVFRDSLIGNINEFIESFANRNIMNDVELAKLVAQAKAVLKDATPQKLRDYSNVRDTVKAQFEAIKTALDPMIEERKTRKFNFAAEDSEAA